MQLAEESAAGVEPHLTQTAVQCHQGFQRPARNFAALGYFLEDALVNQVEKLRHHGKNSDLPLVQRPQQFRGVQCFQIDHLRALHQRQQQIRHLGEHMKERQHSEHRIVRTDLRPFEYRFHFAQQVGVGKHHALGIGSRAGGVEQGSDHIRFDQGGRELVRA